MSAILRLYRGENNIDFKKWWRVFLVLSSVLLVISVASLFTRGLNLGIDFEGGVSWEVPAPGVSAAQARGVLEPLGEGQAKVQTVGSDRLRVQAGALDEPKKAEIRQSLADLAKVDVSEVEVSDVGPSWGKEITKSAERALVVFLLVILAYLTIRLEWKMAVGAVVAMIHDVIISVGVYSVLGLEVTPATVIAFLTILGYSIYDTIVVFDKVKENQARPALVSRMTYTDLSSLSMNQVLLRSINTSVVALLPVLSMLIVGAGILGAVTLEEFAIALVVGLTAGAYSSIFVAAPIVVMLKEREPRNRALRERLAGGGRQRGEAAAVPAKVAARVGAGEVDDQQSAGASVPAGAPSGPATRVMPASGVIPPRPRKKGKTR